MLSAKTVRALAALTLLLLAAPAGAAEIYEIDAAHSEVSFQVRHMVTKVRGRFNDFAGTVELDRENPEKSSVRFVIQTDSIDTNVERRDEHLRTEDFFHVEKYPEITFESQKIEDNGGDLFDVHGTLTIRGVSKPVVLPVELLGTFQDPWGNARAGFATSTVINRKDYGIEWNRALDTGGVLLGDDVTVEINLQAILKKEEAKTTESSE